MVSLRYWLTLFILVAVSWGCADTSIPEVPPLPHYITTFGTFGRDPGEFEYPEAIAIGPDGLLYITDTGNHRVQVFTSGGEFVRQLPLSGPGSKIVVAPDSSVYLDLYYGTGLSRYTSQGQLMNVLDFVNRVQVFEIDPSGNLYICGLRVYGPDPRNPFIEGPYVWKFNPQQELIKKWGYSGPSDTTGWNGGPMTWNTKGNLLVMGQLDGTTAVFEFTPEGDRVSSWRVPPQEFGSPEDIACDRSGRVLLSNPYTNLIYIFDSHGNHLVDFGDVSKDEEPLKGPTGIVVDMSGFIYVADFYRYRVVKYQQAP